MNYEQVKTIIAEGYNCIAINEDKTPKRGWKEYQDKPVTSLTESTHYALICGFNDVECIDVDTKILPSKEERDAFWNSLLSMISDHIDDYAKKLVIKKTRSGGYHIIYRAKNIEGNLKLARLSAYKEAIIETRGLGGYICMYDDSVNLDYRMITQITDDERDILIGICRTFNEVEDDEVIVPNHVVKQYQATANAITPWQDYNQKTSIFDVIGSEFSVVKDLPNKTLIRRTGAKSPHSGYVFKNSGCMYLFSTGTIYEAQKLISPFIAYAVKNFNGDYSRAASDLYSKGYGDRKKPEAPKKIKEAPIVTPTSFPIDIFPKEVAAYVKECARTLQNSIDYMGCALLWVGSLCIGNSLRVEVKKGWQEIATIWLAIVGGAGVGKSPSITSITYPLERINGEERKRYAKLKKEYDEYMALSKKEKEQSYEVKEPQRSQFIVDDVTIEALINLHSQNPVAVGVLKDELAGWFKDMNKYKEGSDKEQWLSSWSGKGIAVDRITRQSDYIAKPCLPVLGGIQPSILSSFFTEENKDSGFLDRMLFSFPDIEVERYVDVEINAELHHFYTEFIVMLYRELKKLVVINDNGDIEPYLCYFDKEAKKEWIRIFNAITDKQNSESTPEFLKSVMAKQKSYIPRFALIVNVFNVAWMGGDYQRITKKSLLDAERLSNYFLAMNEKMISSNMEVAEVKSAMGKVNGSMYDKIKAIHKQNRDFNRSSVARELGISRVTLYKYINEIEQNGAKGVSE